MTANAGSVTDVVGALPFGPTTFRVTIIGHLLAASGQFRMATEGCSGDVAKLVEAEEIEAAVSGDDAREASFVGASASSLTSWAAVAWRTRRPCSHAATPRLMSQPGRRGTGGVRGC